MLHTLVADGPDEDDAARTGLLCCGLPVVERASVKCV